MLSFMKIKKLQFVWAVVVSWMVVPAFAGNVQFQTECRDNQERATISFVGDILVHEALYRAVVGGTRNFEQIWKRTNPLMEKAHFSVGNLEGPAALGIDRRGRDHGDVGFIYDEVVYSGSNFSFNYHPRILGDLKRSGYDLLTLANNHTLDRGALGVDRTLQAAEKAGMPLVGVRASQDRNGDFFSIADIEGIRVAFLGCTEMSNGHEDRKDQLLFCYGDSDRVVRIIKELAGRRDVDAVIVLPHWGQEYKHAPDSRQKSYARKYLEAGALAVVGSHPHVLQPWEKYVTKDGRETLIAYSLGNFVAGQAGLARKTGVVAYLGLARERDQVRLFGVAYTPTYRDGTEVYPVENRSDVLKHAGTFFGSEKRLVIQGDLMNKLCQKSRSTAHLEEVPPGL